MNNTLYFTDKAELGISNGIEIKVFIDEETSKSV
jgi:hypothetical protein